MKIEYNQPISDFVIFHKKGKYTAFFEDFILDDEKENAVVRLDSVNGAKSMLTSFYQYKKRNPGTMANVNVCARNNVFIIWKEKK